LVKITQAWAQLQIRGRTVMSNPEWTPERVAALMALWQEDITTSEIGRRLGITKNAVIGKVHRLGLPKRRVTTTTAEETAEVVQLDMLGSNMCSWPVGNPGERGFSFCGAPALPGKPYCSDHCAVAYIKASRDRGRSNVG
jgi:GcrA cell cycle regulator